jgi:hypothetical protein
MGWLALAVAAAGALFVALPGGMYAAMSLAILAIALGGLAYRQRRARGSARLAGAAGLTVGSIALALAAAQYALTWAALDHLASMF